MPVVGEVIRMYFDHAQYVSACLIVPGLVMLFSFYMAIGEVLQFVRLIYGKRISKHDVWTFLFILLIAGFFLRMEGGVLLHGGIYLLTERLPDAIEMQGYISEIEGLGRYSFPRIKSNYGYGDTNGVEFTIDGVQCTAVLQGTLEIGDYVSVKYLPKSGYVLYISQIEDESK